MEKTLSEDYCSYEVAKLLEEKGFPMGDHLLMYVNKDDKLMTDHQACLTMTNEEYRTFFDNYIPTVTQALAMKWLREEKKTAIIIEFDLTKRGFCPYVHQLDYDMDWVVKWRINTPMKYEGAVEAALKYCLTNLI